MFDIKKIKDIEQSIDQFIDSLPCKADAPYPEIRVEKQNPRYAKLLLDAYADGEKSELTAIGQYLNHHTTINTKEIADSELCIALVEMKHFMMLSDLIEELGTNPKLYRSNRMWWSGGEVSYGDTDCIKLKMDIESEKAAVAGYELLLSEISDKYIRNVLKRILEDEKVHLDIFTQLLSKYCSR